MTPLVSRQPAEPSVRTPLREILIGLVVMMSLLAGCGDDGRPTTAAHRLTIEPCQGRLNQRATAAAVGPDLVATVAHSLEGAGHIELIGADGLSQSASVVYLDPGKDIALLRPERSLDDHLELVRPDGPGPVGVLRYHDGEQPVIDPGEIIELVDVTLDGEGRRAAARLRADIEAGDSGAAVLDDNGDMVAMVFATARSSDIGWAVSSVELQDAIDALQRNRPGAEPPTC